MAEYEDSGALDAFQPSRKFVYGAYVDEPLLMLSCSELAGGGRTETAYYYHQDRNFNVIAMTDDTGQLAERYTYSAYGERATLQDAGLANPYFFTGRRFDAELRIYYYRARYHDPALGRFLNRDPGAGAGGPDRMGDGGAPAATGRFIPRDPTGSNQYADGMNLYQYAKGAPTSYVDPAGTRVIHMCNACDEGKWLGLGFRVGATAGTKMDPDDARQAIAITALFEFLGSVPKAGEDVISAAVNSITTGEPSSLGVPATTIQTALTIEKIMNQRAFMWTRVRCSQCACDDESDTGYSYQFKKWVWHRCTFSDYERGAGLPDFNNGPVHDARSFAGLIQLGALNKSELQKLKRACQLEGLARSEYICGNDED